MTTVTQTETALVLARASLDKIPVAEDRKQMARYALRIALEAIEIEPDLIAVSQCLDAITTMVVQMDKERRNPTPPSNQDAEDEPDNEYDPGPEIDDEGGMSEYRFPSNYEE